MDFTNLEGCLIYEALKAFATRLDVDDEEIYSLYCSTLKKFKALRDAYLKESQED